LLDEGADRNKEDFEGITPLHRAADNGNLETAKLLLKKPIKVNCIDKSGWTPLHVAAMHNDVEMIKLLLNKGANINSRDFSSNTPLSFARQNSAKDAASFLRKNGAKEFTSSSHHSSKDLAFYDDMKHSQKYGQIFVTD
jgi:ankyrin repeat protein